MLNYGPTGALSEYNYQGGVFHGVHYGDFHGDSKALFELIGKEEEFLLKSPERKRILFDLYYTDLTKEVLDYLMKHLLPSQKNCESLKKQFVNRRLFQ